MTLLRLSSKNIIRYICLIFITLVTYPLTGQQPGSAPVITLLSPVESDSLNNSGVVLVRAEIASNSSLEAYRIIHDRATVVDQAGMKPEQKDDYTFIIGSFVPLKKGLNSIQVEATNSFGTSTTESRIIKSHLEPFVTWLQPVSDNDNFESGTADIKVEIKTGYTLNNLIININGIKSANAVGKIKLVNDNTYILEETIRLNPGKNSIYISADNIKGETISAVKTFNFGIAPLITILAPLPEDSINCNGLTVVRAEIVSKIPLQTFRIVNNESTVVSENEMKPEKKDEITYVIASNVPLKKGFNTIYVEAKNSMGKSASQQRIINSHLEPFIKWINPGSDNIEIYSGKMNIKAEIKTTFPVETINTNLNGIVFSDEKTGLSILNSDTYIFEKAVQFKYGKNTIYITAVNARGSSSSATRNINFGNAPVITLISPSSSDSINTSGMGFVNAEIISFTELHSFRIVHNGLPVISETEMEPVKKDSITYSIQTNVPLKKGENTFYIEAKNIIGTSSSTKRTIYCQSEPFITWLLPFSENSTTESEIIDVKAVIKSFLDLQSVKLNLNGIDLDSHPGELTRIDEDTYVFERTLQSTLSTRNSLFLTASNVRGITTSLTRNISYLSGKKPVITVAATDSLNNSGIILFNAEIVSPTKLNAIRIIHNGTILMSESALNPEQKDSVTYIVKTLVPLRSGQNTLYIEAKNIIGTANSEKLDIICQPEPIIKWVLPATTNSTAGDVSFYVKAEIITSFDLLNASINLNGTVLPGQMEGITRLNNDTYILEKFVPLKAGNNTVFLIAGNARGTANSVTRNVIYTPGAISEIEWVSPIAINTDIRTPEFKVSANIITESDIKSSQLFINGTEVLTGDLLKTTRKNSGKYLYENTITLSPGNNTIELSVLTGSGTISSGQRTITYTAPVLPALTWKYPSGEQLEVNQASLDIRMNIKSAGELENIAVYVNGKILDNVNLLNNVRKENDDFILAGTLLLKPGENTIYVSAGNLAGIASSDTRRILYTVPLMPVIAWGNPETNVSTTSSSTITITANITSTTDLQDLKIYCNGNVSALTSTPEIIDKQQGVYHIEETVSLIQGENRIYIEAGNMAGISNSDTRSVNYLVVSAPVITWISPSRQNTDINLNSAKIKATIKSSDNLHSLLVYVNGTASEEINQIIPEDNPGEYTVEKTINLLPGENNIYLIATNNKGTTRSEDRYLTNPPANPPVVSWSIPTDPNTIVNSDIVVIEVCIKSATELKSAQIFVNGVQQASEMIFPAPQTGECNYRLTKPVLLQKGDNSLRINATNYAGSEWSEVRQIRYQATIAEKRLALVIGNADYGSSMILRNPVNDANLIEGTLKSLDFEVIKRLNATKSEMEQAVRDFSKKLTDYNVALFYYAGHGMQVDGENYLIPTDALMKEQSDCKWEAIRVNFVVEEFEKVPENVNIVILDACRNNPFRSWVRGGEQGFRALNAVSGTIVSFATSEGATAADGLGSNGTYTEELVKQMLVPQSISSVFINTRKIVMQRTNNTQRPQEWNMLTGDFYFKR